MQNGVFFVAVIVLVSEFSIAQLPTAGPETPSPAMTDSVMKLPDATPVLLRTKQAVSSATAKVGDRVPFRVTEDVRVGDLIVIHRGAEAWGVVTAVQPRARKGHAGTMNITIQSTQLLTGEPAPLRAEEHLKGVGRSMGSDAVGVLAESRGIALPLLPLIMLEKGKDVHLDADTKVTAYLNGDMTLDRTAIDRVQPPQVHPTGPATVTIFRTSSSTGSVYAPSVYCGKIALARLSNGRYLRIKLPSGKFLVRSNDNQVLELHLEEGQEIYLQMQLAVHGMNLKGHVVQVSTGEGEDEVANLREMNAKDVIKVSDVSLAELQAMPEKK